MKKCLNCGNKLNDRETEDAWSCDTECSAWMNAREDSRFKRLRGTIYGYDCYHAFVYPNGNLLVMNSEEI